ncbi:sigma 54-interacting transcriptional regulator [Thermoanaerobacterium sp. DL9XJH110]|uniref:sigma 54-interacting transcriptional regulator n=1 Tax=Thermoanaerobacterium sp. DL9XJH110 TaxID=3386643 RepID=UPI003BB58B65
MSKILLVAPYKNIAESAYKVAKNMGINTPIIIEIGNMEEGLKAVKKHQGIDVVISRGGTAEMISSSFQEISVVEIKVSINDFMKAISNVAKRGVNKIGVVNRANILIEKNINYEMFGVKIYMRPCENVKKISDEIKNLYNQGIQAVVGDKLAVDFAERYNLVTELLDSGEISIMTAIKEAVNIVKAKEHERLRSAQLNAIIDNIEEGVISITNDKRINFCNRVAKAIYNQKQNLGYSDIETLINTDRSEMITDINGIEIFAKVIPVYSGEKHEGNIITLQKVSNIQDFERKIRSSLYKKGLYAKHHFEDIIGESESIKSIIDKAKKYACTNSNVLIVGETGTGKEIFAQSMHNYSERKSGPFVSINCASLPPSIIESELFGYAEGAFTGARKGGKPGLFELAHQGTLFLDEIGELPLEIQGRLLRVLQEKEIMRLGDDKIIPIDVRIICATNRNLLEMVKQGKFREDLYYRINVLKLNLPPLRERVKDILPILKYYIKKYSKKKNGEIIFKDEAVHILENYKWPGNIRELRNFAEKLVVLCEDSIVDSNLVSSLLNEEAATFEPKKIIEIIEINKIKSLKEIEAQIIRQLSEHYTPDELCSKLGISRVTLWRKLNYYKNEKKEIHN